MNDLKQTPSDSAQATAHNMVDRASASADQALDATRRAADAAIDGVAEKIHGLRDRASPALDRFTSPYDEMLQYTRERPGPALLSAAAVGAATMALLVLLNRGRR